MDWKRQWAGRTAGMKRSAVRELLKLTAQPEMISFAGGLPSPEHFPVDEIARASSDLLRERGAAVLQYGETEGIGELRDWIAKEYSTPARPLNRSQVMITSGAQQALDLAGRVFLNPDETVLVEDPTYLAALSAWRPTGARFEAVRRDGEGLDATWLARRLQQPAKLLYLIPNFQNPTGQTLAGERRPGVVAAVSGAAEPGVVCIEDDPYGALRYEGERIPSLFQLAGDSRGEESSVVATGTFSKVLAPGLRVGWVVGPEAVIGTLVRAKQAADLHTSTFNQALVLELLRRGVVERHQPGLVAAYRERRDAMLEALLKAFGDEVRWNRPTGGMFLWLTLPEGVDAARLLERAVSCGVAFVPGEEFHLNGGGRNTLRLNFTHASVSRIREGVVRLGRAWRELKAGASDGLQD